MNEHWSPMQIGFLIVLVLALAGLIVLLVFILISTNYTTPSSILQNFKGLRLKLLNTNNKTSSS